MPKAVFVILSQEMMRADLACKQTVSQGLAGNRKERMFDIDHVVPDNWGGINHPRNMVVMHRSMNRSFKDVLPETKWYYLSHRKSGVLRRVAFFVKEVLGKARR